MAAVVSFFLVILMLPGAALAAPGDVLFQDNFDNRNTLAPVWTADVATAAGISAATSNSAPNSLYTRHQAVTVTSQVIDLTVKGADLSFWVRRGDDAFSEDPDNLEDFVIEFLDSVGSWVNLATYPGNGTPGEIITDTIPLPFSALHANFQLRVRQTAGSGTGWDYWHLDDVLIIERAASRPPLTLGTCDDFEQGMSNWTVTASGGNAGINTATFQSPSSSMFTNGGVVTVTSNVIDTNTSQFSGISMWIRRGSDTFSEDPDGGENLVVEYLDNTLNWVTLETFSGAGSPGEIFTRNYTLPASARHANFQIRFTQTGGNAGIFDFWHVDDVCIEGTTPFPAFVIYKDVSLEDDPVNNTSNPKAIPLSNSVYRVRVANAGVGSPDPGTLVVSDDLPANLEMFTGNFSGGAPSRFTDGAGADASGVTCNFISLADTTDCITFYNSSGAPIVPNGGYDPSVRRIEFRPAGVMNPSTGSNTPYFDIEFRVRVLGP